MNGHVCSIYKALQLKEFFVPQNAIFYYENLSSNITFGKNENSLTAAFQATELLALIPNPIEKDGYTYTLSVIRGSAYRIEIAGNQIDADELVFRTEDKNLPDALAASLIFLIENEFVDFDQ